MVSASWDQAADQNSEEEKIEVSGTESGSKKFQADKIHEKKKPHSLQNRTNTASWEKEKKEMRMVIMSRVPMQGDWPNSVRMGWFQSLGGGEVRNVSLRTEAPR